MKKVPANAYIDAFNLYYGALQGTSYKWLDLRALLERLFPQNDIRRIRYFTARVGARPGDLQQPQRQAVYLRALQTLPGVSIHYGTFLQHRVPMRLVHPPPVGSKYALVYKTEEKGSDVALASHLLLDGFRKEYEAAIVVSNDSDLAEPVRMVKEDLGLKVGVANPHKRRSKELEGDFFRQIRPSHLKSAQLPPTLTDEKGTFHRPPSW
jgi:uncharacterized LabA/DUF88 family protein